MADEKKIKPLTPFVTFATAGLGGLMGWVVVHPASTLAVRMNLTTASGAGKVSFLETLKSTIKTKGAMSLYDGLSAGLLRQLFYATSRFGLFEVFRDELAKHRPTDFLSRLLAGVTSGGIAALISCPAEVTLVRISNDATLPAESRRNYKGVIDAFRRIAKEEGPKAFFRGSAPFVNRAMVVGTVQVGTYDQFRDMYKQWGGPQQSVVANTFYAAMTSGLIYALATMPFETTKNRMAFQKADPVTGQLPYTSTVQSIRTIIRTEGPLALWAGFPPYYLRCGGHTVFMFMSIEWLRKVYRNM